MRNRQMKTQSKTLDMPGYIITSARIFSLDKPIHATILLLAGTLLACCCYIIHFWWWVLYSLFFQYWPRSIADGKLYITISPQVTRLTRVFNYLIQISTTSYNQISAIKLSIGRSCEIILYGWYRDWCTTCAEQTRKYLACSYAIEV